MTPRLEAHGLAWHTPEGRPALVPTHLALHPGERVAVTGPSGSGKSTLLRLLVGLLAPSAGSVLHDGAPLDPTTVLAVRRRVRWVPQRPVGVASTVGDDLAVARAAAPHGLDAAAQRALLAELGLGPVPHHQPFERLSGGEQQRVALVRALTGAPEVLLLDEPTAALDEAHRACCEAVLSTWQAADPTRAWLWVTHDPAQRARVATRTVVLAAP